MRKSKQPSVQAGERALQQGPLDAAEPRPNGPTSVLATRLRWEVEGLFRAYGGQGAACV